MPETYTFTTDAITYIGLVGVTSTAIILFTSFRNYWITQTSK